jgi:hypothetical protein
MDECAGQPDGRFRAGKKLLEKLSSKKGKQKNINQEPILRLRNLKKAAGEAVQ